MQNKVQRLEKDLEKATKEAILKEGEAKQLQGECEQIKEEGAKQKANIDETKRGHAEEAMRLMKKNMENEKHRKIEG